MNVVIICLGAVVLILVIAALRSQNARQSVQRLRSLALAVLPAPSVEWIVRSALDKVADQCIATLRGKVLPRHVTITVSDETYAQLEPAWPRIARDMTEEIAETARAEGWEHHGVTFAVKANSALGRREVNVALVYPTSAEVPTSHAAGERRQTPRRGRTEATLVAAHALGSRWHVERVGQAPVPLAPGVDVVVGAAPNCDIIISAADVSRRHLRIQYSRAGDLVEVEDLDSTNGTSIGAHTLSPKVPLALTKPTTLRLGTSEMIRIAFRPETVVRQ